ncbi:MAG TPA: glycerophosphodiester phosphodiesterase family protein [Pyrinomonadaceae bacterium]|nr:glycerophosphodiester phosphodiesterase family protein [Pyrinomonadaceae bacterium]
MHNPRHSPLIIAHRGASAFAPENTLAAFERAIEEGADGLEFDVRIAKDGVPIVFHDATLRRIAQKRVSVTNFTAEELGKLDVGSWFNFKYPKKANTDFSRETVPTLTKFLDFLGDFKGLLYLELKCKESEIATLVKNVTEIVKKSKLFPNIIIKSFKLEAVAQTNKLLPEVRTAALFAPEIMTLLKKQSHLIDKAKECKADELSLHFSLATQKLVESADRQGMPTLIWTADHPVWVKRASEIGLKAIITNNPARLLAKRHEFFNKTSILI